MAVRYLSLCFILLFCILCTSGEEENVPFLVPFGTPVFTRVPPVSGAASETVLHDTVGARVFAVAVPPHDTGRRGDVRLFRETSSQNHFNSYWTLRSTRHEEDNEDGSGSDVTIFGSCLIHFSATATSSFANLNDSFGEIEEFSFQESNGKDVTILATPLSPLEEQQLVGVGCFLFIVLDENFIPIGMKTTCSEQFFNVSDCFAFKEHDQQNFPVIGVHSDARLSLTLLQIQNDFTAFEKDTFQLPTAEHRYSFASVDVNKDSAEDILLFMDVNQTLFLGSILLNSNKTSLPGIFSLRPLSNNDPSSSIWKYGVNWTAIKKLFVGPDLDEDGIPELLLLVYNAFTGVNLAVCSVDSLLNVRYNSMIPIASASSMSERALTDSIGFPFGAFVNGTFPFTFLLPRKSTTESTFPGLALITLGLPTVYFPTSFRHLDSSEWAPGNPELLFQFSIAKTGPLEASVRLSFQQIANENEKKDDGDNEDEEKAKMGVDWNFVPPSAINEPILFAADENEKQVQIALYRADVKHGTKATKIDMEIETETQQELQNCDENESTTRTNSNGKGYERKILGTKTRRGDDSDKEKPKLKKLYISLRDVNNAVINSSSTHSNTLISFFSAPIYDDDDDDTVDGTDGDGSDLVNDNGNDGESKTDKDESEIGVIVGPTIGGFIAVILFVGLVWLVVVFWKKKQQRKNKAKVKASDQEEEDGENDGHLDMDEERGMPTASSPNLVVRLGARSKNGYAPHAQGLHERQTKRTQQRALTTLVVGMREAMITLLLESEGQEAPTGRTSSMVAQAARPVTKWKKMWNGQAAAYYPGLKHA
ncbi:hypothetical protein QOT17_015384 [Balamuthia mandrillaris]